MYHALTNDCPVEKVNGIKRPQLKILRNQIDKKHFYNFEPSDYGEENIKMQLANRSSPEHKVFVPNKDYTQSQFEYVAKNKLHKGPNDGHPSPEGHRQWGQLLWQFVKKNGLFPN